MTDTKIRGGAAAPMPWSDGNQITGRLGSAAVLHCLAYFAGLHKDNGVLRANHHVLEVALRGAFKEGSGDSAPSLGLPDGTLLLFRSLEHPLTAELSELVPAVCLLPIDQLDRFNAGIDAPDLIAVAGAEETGWTPQELVARLDRLVSELPHDEVPILVATRDPDYNVAALPRHNKVEVAPEMARGTRVFAWDPAEWEFAFARGGFSVIEQRPVHLRGLPDSIATILFGEHARLVHCEGYCPPRQGPYYFWLIVKRAGTATQDVVEFNWSEPVEVPVEYLKAEGGSSSLELQGNLLSRVHFVRDGQAEFKCKPAHIEMVFSEGTIFGQLELSGNYAAGRVLGWLGPTRDLTSGVAASADLRQRLRPTEDLGDLLFTSLLQHMDSIRFDSFISAGKATNNVSRVFPGIKEERVRNCAAVLLQKWSHKIARLPETAYRSRVQFCIDEAAVTKHIYGRTNRSQSAGEIVAVMKQFAAAGIIDSFSAPSVRYSQDTLGDDECDAQKLHIGWIAARFLDHHFPLSDETIRQQRFYDLALIISAALGFQDDLLTIRNNRDRKQFPSNRAGKIFYITEELGKHSALDQADIRKLNAFLNAVVNELHFSGDSKMQQSLDLSHFVVLRDIWALLACLLDAPEMWRWDASASIRHERSSLPWKESATVFLQELVSYLGAEAGFADSPWCEARCE